MFAASETHWVALRLSSDVEEIRELHREHTARFDSMDTALRTLTQMVGQVLERRPEEPHS